MSYGANESSVEQCSQTHSKAACASLSDSRSDNESLNAGSIVFLEPDHRGLDDSDARGVAHIHTPSDIDHYSDSLNVGYDISFRIEHVKVEDLDSVVAIIAAH